MLRKIEIGLRALLLPVLLSVLLGTPAEAFDTGWMQKGVRIWYMGGGISADQEEAYLIAGVDGSQMSLTRHSAASSWTSPLPAETATYPRLDKGPCWIHPQVLENLQIGQTWMGQEITFIDRQVLTYETFAQRYLPAWALFKLTPQRLLIKITHMIPHVSQGVAYFDADTGLLLYRDYVSVTGAGFFILSEINYNFGTKRPFPEDNGPHTGFMSVANEASATGGGLVVIHSLVESRYGNSIKMRVDTSLTGPVGLLPLTIENVCFFGDVPMVRHKDFNSTGNIPPENWDPYGRYLWWWLPPEALAGASIDVLGVPLTRITAGAATALQAWPAPPPIKAISSISGVPPSLTAGPQNFTAASNPSSFHFSSLWFGENGYMNLFSAKATTIGLDVREDQIFQNNNTVIGLDYYGNTMGVAIPVTTPAMFLPLIKCQ